jgi:hypothetical protein
VADCTKYSSHLAQALYNFLLKCAFVPRKEAGLSAFDLIAGTTSQLLMGG